MKLSIVVPAHNEQDNIEETVNRLKQFLSGIDYELVIVDDHSEDETASLVKKLAASGGNISLVENKSEKGFSNALKAGFSQSQAEVVLPLMADISDDLKSVPHMLEKIAAGYDVVCGSRYIPGGARLGGSKIKGLLSRWAGMSLYFLLKIPTHDIANSFKMYRKSVLDSIDIKSAGFEVSMEMLLKAYFLGFKITEVPTVWKERVKGRSSFRIMKLLPAYLALYGWAVFKKVFRSA